MSGHTVTVLFCDVSGSTAMAEQLDPEDWAEIMNEAFGYLMSPVYENANYVLNEDVDEAVTVDDRLRGRWPDLRTTMAIPGVPKRCT